MRQKLEKQIEDLGPWFQNMAIAGVETAPDHFLGNYPAFKW
ncbi:TIGR04290 family methyltransferase, partial [Mesorhizobium sp. M8A.F.Ca.ET.161.01.1.1]